MFRGLPTSHPSHPFMKLHLLLVLLLACAASSCKKPAVSALSPADEKRLAELRELEERAAQREAEAKMTQLEADRQKLAEDQAALEEEKRQLAAERAAAQNNPQLEAQYLQSERRLQEREKAARLAEERAEAAERAAEAAREAHETKRAAATKKIDFFYDALDPLGDWMEVEPYGYVWQPREADSRDWRPYTDGTWVYTDYGWTWKGNEPFGWATYHYGRWTRLQKRGWVWVPGSEWAPAWVSWRKSPEYVGWAPLPPEAHSSNGFNGAVDSYYDIGPESYTFVPARSIGEPTYRGHVVEPARNFTIIVGTSNVTRMGYANYGREPVYYNEGPDYDEISRYGGRPVPRYRLERESSRERFNGSAASATAGSVLRMLAPQIAPAPRAVATPTRVKERLGMSAPDHGWGTGGNAQGFRAKAQQEAAQAEQIARTQPAATPFIRSGWRPSGGPGASTPKPLTGPFGTGPTPPRFGTGNSPATPHVGTPPVGTPTPPRIGAGNGPTPPRFGPPATPLVAPGTPTPPRFGHSTPKLSGFPERTPKPLAPEPVATPKATGGVMTPPPRKPLPELATPVPQSGVPATPTPPVIKGKKPLLATPRPGTSTPVIDDTAPSRPVPLITPRPIPSTPLPITTPRPGRPTPPARDIPPLATPKLKPQTVDGNPAGSENATPPRVVPTIPKATPPRMNKPTPPEIRATPPPPPAPRFTPPPSPPAPPATRPNGPPTPPVTRPATGGGNPVIPNATPRKFPMTNPEGGADPRKVLPPPITRPGGQATPAGSPTPKKR